MSKPILKKPYTRSESTDIRETFELERRRLTALVADQLARELGQRLDQPLLGLAYPVPDHK